MGKFQLNLPGLLKVLAEHLYSTKKVALRELIQNAHDSCVRRQAEDKQQTRYRPKIMIQTDPIAKRIRIEDNGAGMTEDEIITYLTTIGNSYTRELGQRLEFLSPDQASQLIGQFGLGFLSSFLIASEVELVTRSYKSEQGYRWACDGGEQFELTPTDHETVGTMVDILLKPEAQFLLEDAVLIDTIRKYADFLPLPIYVNRDPMPINLMAPPWEANDFRTATQDYVARVFHQQNAICVIGLHDETIDLGHDSIVIPLQGFVYIPPSSVVSLREYGDLRVYIRRMFIMENNRDLLPTWAKFFRGVIDCPLLQPTASREDLHQEDNFLAVQQALENQLLMALRVIAAEEPQIWKQIVLGHTDLVLGWIVANDEFFDHVADSLLLRTTRGILPLSDYLEQSRNTFYFVTREIGSLQDQLLGEGYEVPVIDASWFAVRAFLEKYAAWHPGVQLIQMDGDARQLMRPVFGTQYDPLIQFYRKMNVVAKVAAFKPIAVPALMLYPRNAETIIEARKALDSGELSSPFAAMIEEYLNQVDRESDEENDQNPHGVLYLNASSPLIQQVLADPPAHLDAVLILIYQIARLFAARTLTPADAGQAFHAASESIRRLMDHG